MIYKLPVRILKGFEIDLWKASRRQVKVDLIKRWKIDGIDQSYAGRISYTTATTNL